jgi:hypothetical protein
LGQLLFKVRAIASLTLELEVQSIGAVALLLDFVA